MGQIKQNDTVWNVDSLNNPVIKEIIIEKVISVPSVAMPDTNKVIAIVSENENISLNLFSKREEIELTNQFKYLGNIHLKRSDYEDATTSFTAVVQYIVEAESASSQAILKLYDYNNNIDITNSQMDTGVIGISKIKLTSPTLTIPTDSIIEIFGKKISGSVVFLSAKINIKKQRKV